MSHRRGGALFLVSVFGTAAPPPWTVETLSSACSSNYQERALNPNLLFGTACFWTLPEVHKVEREIEALTDLFRRSIGMERGSGEIPRGQNPHEIR